MGRIGFALACMLMAPILAGCVSSESLHVALRVPTGETFTLTGAQHVNGTLFVERGGTLVLRDADLVIAQALAIDGGTVVAERSVIRFEGAYSRQNLEMTGGVATFTDSDLHAARSFELRPGTLTWTGGSVETRKLSVAGSLASDDVHWRIGSGGHEDVGITLTSGTASFTNGTIDVMNRGQGVVVTDGRLDVANLTFRFTSASSAFQLQRGALEAWNASFSLPDQVTFLSMQSQSVARLVDTPMPRNQGLPDMATTARLEVAWTLVAEARSMPGQIPVAGLNVTLTSAHDPTAVSSSAVTDEHGNAHLVAVEYVLQGDATRSGNPHAIRASGGGQEGAMLGVVVERPMRVVVPVAG